MHSATWGEFLGDLGFSRPERISEVVDWWRQVIISRQIAVVVADYAPLALLAARTLGIATFATGTGYGLPPWQMPEFPMLRPEHNTRLHDEATLLANVNFVATRHGLAPLSGLPEVYRASTTLVRTLPFLDPYHPWRRDSYLPPVTDISPVSARDGDEVFVYFSTTEIGKPAVVEALTRLNLPRRGYLPGAPTDVTEKLAASGMILETGPVPVTEIARRSRLVLNAGQHGILSLGLYAGLPQVCLPQHQEQLWHARAAERKGVARVVRHVVDDDDLPPGALIDAVHSVYADRSMFDTAVDLSHRLREDLDSDPDTITARAIRPLIAPLLNPVSAAEPRR